MMQDPSYELRNAYYTALNGNITYEGNPVGIYDEIAPQNATAQYILLREQTNSETGDKTNYGFESTILLEIISEFTATTGGKHVVDNITDQVLAIVKTGVELDLGNDFKSIVATLAQSNTFSLEDKQGNIKIVKQLRLSHEIDQEANSYETTITVKNSNSTFEVVLSPSGTPYILPDITHTDSNGALVTKPAQTPFVATPGGAFGFAGSELAANNTYIDLFFTEEAYSTALASGALTTADLSLTFAANGGTATGASITSLTKLDGTTALAGGEIGIRAFLSITGTPSGVETITVTPVVNSVFDIDGNAMATSESESLTLNSGITAELQGIYDNIETKSGETLTAAEKADIKTCYDLLDWSTYKYFVTPKGLDTVAKSSVDWVGGKVLTNVNAATWAKATGYTGDGSTKYLKTGYNPSLDLAINNITIDIKIGTVTSGSQGEILFGNYDGTNIIQLSTSTTPSISGFLGTTADTASFAGALQSGGHYSLKRDTEIKLYENAVLKNTVASPAAAALANLELYLMTRNQNGSTVTPFFNEPIEAFAVGTFDLAAHRTALATFYTNRGV